MRSPFGYGEPAPRIVGRRLPACLVVEQEHGRGDIELFIEANPARRYCRAPDRCFAVGG
jgi:hypothetical protein